MVLVTNELAALQDLYNVAGGQGWNHRDNWLIGDPCANAWYGITCSQGSPQHVTSIFLYNRNIVAAGLPSSLGTFSQLTTLQISHNPGLSGPIPDSIGNLTALITLNLDDCGFRGTSLPSTLSNLVNLVSLSVQRSGFAGPFPSLANMTRLDYVTMSFNSITTLPDLPLSITHLDAADCAFSGGIPAAYFRHPNLTYLNLYQAAGPMGTLPADLGNMTSLKELHLDNMQLSGPLPLIWPPNLQHFEAHSNHLSGTIPAALFSLPKLVSLDLAYCSLQGTLPPLTLPNLQTLSIQSNKFSGPMPDLTVASSLVSLDVSSNSLSGPLPAMPSSITAINVVGCHFSLLPDLTGLSNLQHVYGDQNSFTGPLVLPYLPNLTELSLSGNAFSGSLSSLSSTPALQSLNLARNGFSGPFPSMKSLTALTTISVSQNSFQGPFPELGNLTAIVSIDMSGNAFSTLPPGFSNMTGLATMDARGNSISDAFPFLGNLASLTSIRLDNNMLYGAFPDISNIPATLTTLTVSNNQLSNALPNGLGLTHLTTLNVANNQLSGALPIDLCNSRSMVVCDVSQNSIVLPGQPCASCIVAPQQAGALNPAGPSRIITVRGLSSASTSSRSSPTVAAAAQSSSGSLISGLSLYTVVGIAGGATLVILILIVCLWWRVQVRKNAAFRLQQQKAMLRQSMMRQSIRPRSTMQSFPNAPLLPFRQNSLRPPPMSAQSQPPLSSDTMHTDTVTLATHSEDTIALPGFYEIKDLEGILRNSRPLSDVGGFASLLTADLVFGETSRLEEFLAVNDKADAGKRAVALKCFPDDESEAQVAAFESEISFMYAFGGCPNIVQLLGYSVKPRTIVLPLYAGSLADILHSASHGSLYSEATVLTAARDIATGMTVVHDSCVAHLDIKPGNILFELDPSPGIPIRFVVADFGIATSVSDARDAKVRGAKLSQVLALSMRYAAPDYFDFVTSGGAGDRQCLLAADVYAFGVVLVEMMARERPWADLDPAAIQEKLRDGARPAFVPSTAWQETLFAHAQSCWGQAWDARPTFAGISVLLSSRP